MLMDPSQKRVFIVPKQEVSRLSARLKLGNVTSPKKCNVNGCVLLLASLLLKHPFSITEVNWGKYLSRQPRVLLEVSRTWVLCYKVTKSLK